MSRRGSEGDSAAMTARTPAETTKPSAASFVEARVADLMTEGLITCAPATPLRGVAALMVAHRVHSVFVFDDGGEENRPELWGIVSDLDLVAAAWADVDTLTAGE